MTKPLFTQPVRTALPRPTVEQYATKDGTLLVIVGPVFSEPKHVHVSPYEIIFKPTGQREIEIPLKRRCDHTDARADLRGNVLVIEVALDTSPDFTPLSA